MRESAIEKALNKAVAAVGGIAYKFRSPSRRGVPDRICLLPGGQILFVELKSTGKELRKLQAYERKRIEDLGFRVEMADSVEDITEVLQNKRKDYKKS